MKHVFDIFNLKYDGMRNIKNTFIKKKKLWKLLTKKLVNGNKSIYAIFVSHLVA